MTHPAPPGIPPRQRGWIYRRWVPWAAGALAFALTLLVGGVLIADWAWRVSQMDTLLDRVEASEAAMGALQDAAAEAFEDHGSGSTEDQDALDSELRALAAEAEIDIAAAGDAVADMQIAFWHVGLERARDAYLQHNIAWQEYMARASESSSEFLQPQEAVNQTFFDAREPFIDALPDPYPDQQLERIVVIFEVPEPSDSGGSGGMSA